MRRGMPAPRGIDLAHDDRMDERNVCGQQEGEAASKTRKSLSFTVDDRLAVTTPWAPLPVQSLPQLRIRGPIRCARGRFVDFSRTERPPSTLCDAFSVRVGFALTGTLPSHKVRLSPRSRPARSEAQ
jgi:hypothetical protein